MRQRAQPKGAPASGNGGQQLTQRRLVGREPSGSWEITSEKAHTPEPPRNYPKEESRQEVPQHLQYQNGAPVESLSRHRAFEKPPALSEKPHLEDFHTLFRNPLHVPDNRYQAYLRGEAARRKRAPIFSKNCFAQTCAGFSIVAVLFLVFVGILFDTQPLYIKGSLQKQYVQTDDSSKIEILYILPKDSERLPAANCAYHAAIAYLLTLVACLYVLYPGWFQAQLYRRQQKYQDIPDHVSATDSTIPTFHTADTNEVAAKYHPGLWNRISVRLKQWLAARGWYSPTRNTRRKNTQYTV